MRVEGTKLTLDLSWFSNNCDPKSGVAHATGLLLGPHAWADTESIYARLEDWLHWLFAKQQKAQTFLRVQCWALIGLSQQESWPLSPSKARKQSFDVWIVLPCWYQHRDTQHMTCCPRLDSHTWCISALFSHPSCATRCCMFRMSLFRIPQTLSSNEEPVNDLHPPRGSDTLAEV